MIREKNHCETSDEGARRPIRAGGRLLWEMRGPEEEEEEEEERGTA